MNKNIKHYIVLLTLIILMIQLANAVSANSYTYSPQEFLDNISNIQNNDVINITSGTATVTSSMNRTINANNITITGNNTVFNGDTNTYFTINGKNITISGITFANNKNTQQTIGGGAMVWAGENGVLKYCNFINNTEDLQGGAIAWSGINGNISHCNFNNNSAKSTSGNNGTGGAIWYYAQSGSFTIQNCKFTNNYAKSGGGAIITMGIDANVMINIVDCNFDNNTVAFNIGSLSGGAILTAIKSIISNCNFTYNKALYGGAIRAYGSDVLSAKNSVIQYCNFKNNSADLTDPTSFAGAICIADKTENCTIKYCNFTNNTAYVGGALLYSSTGLTEYCNFINNTAMDGGAALVWKSCNLNKVQYCNFTNNTAKNMASAILCTASPSSTILNCTFTDCNSNVSAIVIRKDSISDVRSNAVKLTNNTFINTVINNPNVLVNESENITITGGANALVLFASSASIKSDVIVTVLGNETKSVKNGEKTNLTAIIVIDSGVNNTIIGLPLNFTIAGNDYTGSVANNSYICEYIPNTVGLLTVCANIRNANSQITYKTGKLDVKDQANVTIQVPTSVAYGNNITLNITAKNKNGSPLSGDAKVYIDNMPYANVTIISGTGKVNITNLNAGNHNVTVEFNNTEYVGQSNTTSFDVYPVTPAVNITAETIVYGQDAVIIVNVTGVTGDIPTGNVTIAVNGKTIVKSLNLIKGNAQYTIIGLGAGKYNITVTYNGNKNYNSKSENKSFIVEQLGTRVSVNVNNTSADTVVLILNLTDINGKPINGDVDVYVISDNGYKYQKTITVNGIKDLSLPNLNTGHYNVTVTFNATENYTSSFANNSFDIIPMPDYYILNASNVVKYYKNGTQYIVKLTDNHGNPVVNKTILVTLNSSRWAKPVSYNITTNASGVAKLDINLIAGEYSIIATFGNATPEINNITVLEVTFVLTAGNVIKYFMNGTHYTVTVTSQFGYIIPNEAITVKIYSEKWLKPAIYTIKTNSSGVAKLDINLIAGIYTITSTVGKTTKYNNIAVYPTLTASSIAKTLKQSANLKARLIDGQGNPSVGKELTFTVGYKTYHLTTDSNGIATLPIGLGLGTWSFLIANPETGATTKATVKVTK